MAADCVNVSVIGPNDAQRAGRDLPVVDASAVNAAITAALANAGPTYDSTNDINAIAAAVTDMTIFYYADVHLIWNPVTVTMKNQLRAALREGLFMVDGENALSD